MTGDDPDGRPEVSVVIPVFNRAELLRTALAGVQAQRGGIRCEVIVVDDASTDGSAAVAAAEGARVVRHPVNLGPGEARASGVAAARGEWVAFLDSDDCWGRDHLATLWAARDGHVLVTTSGVTEMRGRVRVLGSPFVRRAELAGPRCVLRPENIIPTGAAIVRTDVLRSVGGFSRERFSEDLEVWLNVLEHGTGTVLPALTVAYRSHPEQTSRERDGMRQGFWRVEAAFRERPWFDQKLRRALRTTEFWDDFRAGGPRRWGFLIEIVRVGGAPDLVILLWHRALRRHRWRLRHARSLRLLAILDGRKR